MEKKVFQLYKERTLGEKINDTFGFLRDNWRPVGLWFVYVMLPLSLIAAMPIQNMFAAAMRRSLGLTADLPATGELMTQNFGSLVSLLLSLLGTALIVTMVQLYLQREQRLEQLSANEVLPPLFGNFGILFLLILALMVVLIPIMIVAVLLMMLFTAMFGTGFAILLLMVAFVVIFPVMTMCMPVYVFERKEGVGVFGAIVKGCKLGWNTLGGLLALILVMGLIVMVLSALLQGPAMGVWIFNIFQAYSSGSADVDSSMMSSLWHYLLAVLMVAGGQLAGMIWTLSFILHYGHAREKVEGVTVDSEIESFENL